MRILNIGCGKDKYGTDFVDVYPSRPEVLKFDADVDRLPYDDNTFEMVYSGNMFEHLTTPSNFFKEVYRVLQPHGELELITDNASFILYALNHHRYEPSKENDNHYFLFTEHHLKNWCKKFGFVCVFTSYERAPIDTDFSHLGVIFRFPRGCLMRLLPEELGAGHIRLIAYKGFEDV